MGIQRVLVVSGNDSNSDKIFETIEDRLTQARLIIERYDFREYPLMSLRKQTALVQLMIVLFTVETLENIWKSPHKENFIKDVTDSSLKIFHVWANDITEIMMKTYSSFLASTNETFRILSENDLTNIQKKSLIDMFTSIFSDTTNSLKPYCVQQNRGRYILVSPERAPISDSIDISSKKLDQLDMDRHLNLSSMAVAADGAGQTSNDEDMNTSHYYRYNQKKKKPKKNQKRKK